VKLARFGELMDIAPDTPYATDSFSGALALVGRERPGPGDASRVTATGGILTRLQTMMKRVRSWSARQRLRRHPPLSAAKYGTCQPHSRAPHSTHQ
jgi:hypothetical protein